MRTIWDSINFSADLTSGERADFFRLPVNATDIQLADIISPVQNFTFVALVIVYILFFLFFFPHGLFAQP